MPTKVGFFCTLPIEKNNPPTNYVRLLDGFSFSLNFQIITSQFSHQHVPPYESCFDLFSKQDLASFRGLRLKKLNSPDWAKIAYR
jgi:hypothetical protein